MKLRRFGPGGKGGPGIGAAGTDPAIFGRKLDNYEA
jgi:hypothetical protein